MAELQRKRSFNTTIKSHDFRKEYKGSFLEKKCKTPKTTKLRSIAEWFLTKTTKKGQSAETAASKKNEGKGMEESVFDRIPNEVLFEILSNCKAEQSSVSTARRISRRFNDCMDHIADVNVNVLSRLVITGLGKKGIEMRWVSYVGQKTKTTIVPWSTVKAKNGRQFEFNFKRFAIQRILLKNVPLSSDLIDFFRRQLIHADLSKLLQLSLSQVDFTPSNSLSLHLLLAPIAKSLEIFEITQCTGMRPDSVTDDHLAQLDASTIRRICIDGVKFGCGSFSTSRQLLSIGDESLRRFARLGAFPTMILDRCEVTTNTVCDYTKEWFEQCNENEKQLRSQVCTVKRCPRVKGSQFEAECRRRGLRCKNRRGSGSLTLYNVQEENTKREFTIALAALEAPSEKNKENEKKEMKINEDLAPSALVVAV